MGIEASPEASKISLNEGGKAEEFIPQVPFIWPEAGVIDALQEYTVSHGENDD